jgi:DNA-binding Xre family transcriptional regulator
MNMRKIEIRLAELNLSKKNLADAVGITPQAINQMIQYNRCSKTNLPKICKALGVSESYFYETDSPGMVNEARAEYRLMKETIEAQRETIHSQTATIELLQKALKRKEPND